MTELPKLSYNECLAAMAIKKVHQPGITDILKEILHERTKMIEDFSPLLKNVINKSPDNLISSEELCSLWIFYCMGVYSNSLIKLQSQTEFTVQELTRLGPVISRKLLYDRCYRLVADSQSNELFSEFNPEDWYEKVISNNGDLESFFKSQNRDEIIPILEYICTALSDPDCDPVKQR